MKEIYDWKRWFRELAKKIAEEGKAYLIEKAEQVEWEVIQNTASARPICISCSLMGKSDRISIH